MPPGEWADDNPYFLLCQSDDRAESATIDLGLKGWAKRYGKWTRRPGWWYLCRKETGQVLLAMILMKGEQAYYVKRHVGQIQLSGGQGRKTAVYGIGKKLLDGNVMRLWVLPDGVAVCGGEDVEKLAIEVVKALEWQEPPPEE